MELTGGSLINRLILPLSAVFLLVQPSLRAQHPILPAEAKVVWDLAQAFHETTPTRERICLNGLWRWQPAEAQTDELPDENWGYFKVPGSWPGITDYMQKDSQTVWAHPAWKNFRAGAVTAARYEREFRMPDIWAGRRIVLAVETLNSLATVFVDGAKAGDLHFPGGELDLSGVCRPGVKHRLSVLVVALPLQGVMLSYTDSASAREVKGTVARRGLCGDVFLVSTPPGSRILRADVDTSVRQRELGISTRLDGLAPDGRYRLRARINKDGSALREFAGPPFSTGDVVNGRFEFGDNWMPDQLWDVHTPQNQFELQLSLLDNDGHVLDIDWRRRFGFREFRIEGRDFFLNGSRIFLSAVPLDNAQVGAAWANYAAARESLERLKRFGINYVYTHNYGCEPGAHLSFTEILRAADDVGILVGFTQPHFSHYDWNAPDADVHNGYAKHAAAYVEAAANHPSVVMYVTSHNSTGYEEDMNPDMIDGVQEGRDPWASRNVRRAARAEAIVRQLDPRRIVYHHASGNLGVMHVSNFYPNFTPVQELDDWFETWATKGVKPAFTCEYGAPFSWDWTMYRGWYQGQREWGSAAVPWEFCLAEWNAQFFGDRAYRISTAEKQNLRWEAKQFHAGKTWHRWDYPNPVGSDRFEERYPVFAKYTTDNWRAYRTWGLSGNSPWEYGHFWKPRPGVDRARREFPVDWENLQRPGFSPDYIEQRYERMDLAFERSDWVATPAAEALVRNNRPWLAYIAGKPGAFTSKDHNFVPGETVEKQIVVINNSRETGTCDLKWSLEAGHTQDGEQRVTIPTGEQVRIPLTFNLPDDLSAGKREIQLTAGFSNGEQQEDSFTIDVLSRRLEIGTGQPTVREVRSGARIALYDPKGETARSLATLGVNATRIDSQTELQSFDVLLIGKEALTLDGPAPDVRGVRDGLNVVVFEQTSAVLERRLGFRVVEYGLRQVFPRVPDHALLAELTEDNLRDWRGSATILPARLPYRMRPRYGPTVEWAGLPVTRPWRCGNRGNVASVLIEKPARGDFLPIVDGGFGMQYSPLMEYREGRGMIVFCQLDLTGRTEIDPTGERLLENLIRYAAAGNPRPERSAVYAGDEAGRSFLAALGVNPRSFDGRLLNSETLVVGPGGDSLLAERAGVIADFLQQDGNLLAVGLNQEEANAFLPFKVTMRNAEHISSWFDAPPIGSRLSGIGPAHVHNRDPRTMPLIVSGARVIGDGVLAQAMESNIVFLQMTPWSFSQGQSFRRTYRQSAVMLQRLLANLGVAGSTPLLEHFRQPLQENADETRWLSSYYLDQPEEWDDPYRFFRW